MKKANSGMTCAVIIQANLRFKYYYRYTDATEGKKKRKENTDDKVISFMIQEGKNKTGKRM